MIERISILGTGLLGASVGLALKSAGFRGSITGWNRGADQGQLALKLGAVDSLAGDGVEAAQASQVTVLAVPIFATLDWMEKLAPVLGPEQLVTDGGAALQHAGAGGVPSRTSDGRQRARRRSIG